MGLLTNLFSAGGATRAWCRPTHRTTCFMISGGNSCCVCIPSTATCFVIEMWGQGGGGAGTCCCSGSPYGGQAGDYGWAVCTTSGTNHILCVCVCNCNCCSPSMGVYAGSPGQISRVINCTVAWCWQANGGCGGSSCCWYDMFACVYSDWDYNIEQSPLSWACCWDCLRKNIYNCYNTFSSEKQPGCCTNYFIRNQPFEQRQGTNHYGCTCNCCQCFQFYVRGGCGYSAPSQWTWAATDQSCGLNQPQWTYCGGGWARGGMAYAGGAAQCCDCSGQACRQFGGVNGNSPGGGGSGANGTGISGGCCLGSCGGLGVVLISYS